VSKIFSAYSFLSSLRIAILYSLANIYRQLSLPFSPESNASLAILINALKKSQESVAAQGIVADYTRKTGASEQQVRDWMAAETWFNAQEALDNKFVDAIDSTTQAAANKWDLSAYQNAPKQPERPAEAVAAHIANRERKLRLLSLT
jgi:hypothetical protein